MPAVDQSFLLRYVRRRPKAHAAIFLAVLSAVGCSVSARPSEVVEFDALGGGPAHTGIWLAFRLFLVTLVVADNLLWRLAGWIRAMPSSA